MFHKKNKYMKTQQILQKKTKYNWFYLLAAILVLIAAFRLSPESLNWDKSNFDIGDTRLWLLLAGLSYLIAWLYGVFYYPFKYNSVLRKALTENRAVTDLSLFRGYPSAIILGMLLFQTIPFDYWHILIIVILATVHVGLGIVVRTDNLFEHQSIMIDEVILMPWLDRGDRAEHRYRHIGYISPILEDQEDWKRRIIIAYVSHERVRFIGELNTKEYHERLARNEAYWEERRRIEREASKFSAKMYEEIK